MPLWLVEYLIALAFFPALLFGLCLLFLAATWHQVKDREEEDRYANAQGH